MAPPPSYQPENEQQYGGADKGVHNKRDDSDTKVNPETRQEPIAN